MCAGTAAGVRRAGVASRRRREAGELGLGGGEGGKRRGDAESLGEKGGAPAPCESWGDESRSARRAEAAARGAGER